jgi:dolichol-phosphate mannosyltransferase
MIQISSQFISKVIVEPLPVTPYTVSILTASLNEVENIELWLKSILEIYKNKKLYSIREVVIVDDGSYDGTVQKILSIKESFPLPIKLIQRNRKMGTLNAQISGALLCTSDYTFILDCDLQHPIELMPKLIENLDKQPDIIIGSRYIKGGVNRWNPYRGIVSRVATFIAQVMIGEARNVKDPLSGYFIIKTNLIRELRPYEGMYKPLLYAISMHKKLSIIEVPVSMMDRSYGESKIVNNPLKMIIKYIREVLVFWVNSKKINKN